MRVPLWKMLGMSVALLALGGCTRSDETPATSPTAPPAAPSPPAAAKAPADAAVKAEPGADEEDAEELLMVWAEAEPEEGAPPLEVQLKADISGGQGEPKVTWSFGDGSPPSNEVNPKHTYDKPGTYRAAVQVSDASGDTDDDYVDIEVATD